MSVPCQCGGSNLLHRLLPGLGVFTLWGQCTQSTGKKGKT